MRGKILKTWNILSVQQNPTCMQAGNDPEAKYVVGLHQEGVEPVTQLDVTFNNVAVLLKGFEVQWPADLAGKSFESTEGSALKAFQSLLDFRSAVDTYDHTVEGQIFHHMVMAMAQFEEPKFDGWGYLEVTQAFKQVWEGDYPDPIWMSYITQLVYKLSDGQVTLERAPMFDFPTLIDGPAEYLSLKRGAEEKLVIIGPYTDPVIFVSNQ